MSTLLAPTVKPRAFRMGRPSVLRRPVKLAFWNAKLPWMRTKSEIASVACAADSISRSPEKFSVTGSAPVGRSSARLPAKFSGVMTPPTPGVALLYSMWTSRALSVKSLASMP